MQDVLFNSVYQGRIMKIDFGLIFICFASIL